MVFWKTAAQPAPAASGAASAALDHSEELLAEVDEPPDDRKNSAIWSPPKLTEAHMKSAKQLAYSRRESLLTRQLHSETEHSDEDHSPQPPRALSTQSIWSTTSTAELTSDDGKSMPSPAISPPLPPTEVYNALPVNEKPLDKKVTVVGEEGKEVRTEQSVEATLGRKRCIMFACRGKDEAKPKPPSPTTAPAPAPASVLVPLADAPPKRKCAIKFACPTRTASDTKPTEPTPAKRTVSPPPPQRKASSHRTELAKVHRGSDSTVTHGSPRSARRSPAITTTVPTPTTAEGAKPPTMRTVSHDSDEAGREATRFHEFASSEDEPEEWVQESTCHRSRLTIDDTLKKESVIRKACEEVEEEVLEEDEEAEQEGEDGDEADLGVDDEDAESDHSDAGFHSDDEDGFAASDSEGEGSDYEWWKPGGSTAATSIEHLDRLSAQARPVHDESASSMNSLSSGQMSPRMRKHKRGKGVRGHARSQAIPIHRTSLDVEDANELPDSTDFVCGTLDEDRPLEQAYLNRVKEKEAAKHKARPQDIDPTFPTSDPEMDEEDDEDLEDPEESAEEENMMHGEMDELDESNTLRRRSPLRQKRGRSGTNRSPPPPVKYHSPPPPTKRPSRMHSPPPPLVKRNTARSPPPRKLFGQSPKRARSPAPINRTTSPPNSRRPSPTRPMPLSKFPGVLAARPQLTRTASLPRGGGFLLSRLGQKQFHTGEADADSDSNPRSQAVSNDDDTNQALPRRGAIDIVKGLEKKRQRRKEKMWQKLCAKKGEKGEKVYKVKPGKGCEKMREVGLELQRYRGGTGTGTGTGGHILSY
ncbi:hypothetical protein BAUCODRAFT_111155 [Baudoinia panamericana UAMH 10762]|uniref:Extensin domain-containing protein n=1 Tax=Baudoinia panamericana (strain UAMH 10762) TaxID=717646 RepID=M2N5N1_BAUPA|nr:uncharacterized protein BAUCODRAFT_111155 [Baudoinia panamericana UAMH 10762]EMC94349.1 hypothetical protein BAUCODRAFT_111155 [Baudoinia panamericana UAMH 10762]